MRLRRDSILVLCIVLIAAILAGCGAAEQRFADRTALSDYLMGKYDTSWGQDTASPFIMENDRLMDGWRPNPDSRSSALG